MAKQQTLFLRCGEFSDVTVSAQLAGEIHCVSGSAHIVNERLGIGWSLREGDCCVLRSETRYRITARSELQMTIGPKRLNPIS